MSAAESASPRRRSSDEVCGRVAQATSSACDRLGKGGGRLEVAGAPAARLRVVRAERPHHQALVVEEGHPEIAAGGARGDRRQLRRPRRVRVCRRRRRARPRATVRVHRLSLRGPTRWSVGRSRPETSATTCSSVSRLTWAWAVPSRRANRSTRPCTECGKRTGRHVGRGGSHPVGVEQRGQVRLRRQGSRHPGTLKQAPGLGTTDGS